ncbi:NAD(P)/FAD-dependent oxidoreductase [Bacteriovorax sp. Seq25_V]|uniref:NAD(P)/FAD-dependent oxidoreductase n=1 Tax=Bacteriovorax sp. Seq25_V TaxID=1201288 RepID=UPI00038A4094|nr:NAD(P)/FAD-dependent oxidoreductase [Bacteriovorax sp. Seq25_V]EQC47124.1 pyridine nucleotide-disulfide oxidoreductase [Bacteriovorax sp. Seq25_V]
MKKHYPTVIIGAGFGGLNAAIKLGKKKKEALIIDRMNHHLFQPLLYQVATAALSPADIAAPIREVLKKYSSLSVIMDEVSIIDKNANSLETKSGLVITFDNLIIATGARHSYFGKDEWESLAPGLKSLEDALHIRENILRSYELSEMATNIEDVKALTTFVVIGGGPTGVEMAGAIAEIASKTMVKNFSHVNTRDSKIYLLEGGPRVLNAFKEELSAKAKSDLERLGVNVRVNTLVTNITQDGVYIGNEFIPSKNIIWAAGNKASPLLKVLDVKVDRMGRAIVESDCSIESHPNIFVIGDACAFASGQTYLPSLAPVAAQQGKYVAGLIVKNLSKGKRNSFKYLDKGIMATIGKSKAVLQVGALKLSGFFAWIAWSLVHVLFLVLFRSKISILLSWVYNYFTEQRGARIIK